MLVFGGSTIFWGYSARVSTQQMIHQTRSEDDHDADTDAIESDVPLCRIVFLSYFFVLFPAGPHGFKRQLDIESCQLQTAQLGIWDHFFNKILQMCHGFAAPFWVSFTDAGKSVNGRYQKSLPRGLRLRSWKPRKFWGMAILTVLESAGCFFFWNILLV